MKFVVVTKTYGEIPDNLKDAQALLYPPSWPAECREFKTVQEAQAYAQSNGLPANRVQSEFVYNVSRAEIVRQNKNTFDLIELKGIELKLLRELNND